MIITYATRHRWVKKLSSDVLQDFGKNDRARLTATLRAVSTLPITSTCAPLDQAFLDTFIPLYESRIREKKHPTVYDIRGKTLGENRRQYFRLSLEEDGVLVGAIIFSKRKNALSLAYRTFNKEWLRAGLRASPSLYAEYLIAQYAKECGMATIIHGRDRNPYGLNSDIGLAAFKLSLGCVPYLSRTYDMERLDTDLLPEDALVFEYPGENASAIVRAYLITTKETEPQWDRVKKYPERLAVLTIYR